MLSEGITANKENSKGNQYDDDAHRTSALYIRFLKRVYKSRFIPRGDKLPLFGASSWKHASLILKQLEGYSPDLMGDGLRLEVVNASLPMPALVHYSNLRFGKRYAVRRLKPAKVANMDARRVEGLIEVIDLTLREVENRICAKKLHEIARKCLNMQANAPIVNTIRIIMAAKGWKAWQTFDGCYYERA